MDIQLLTPTKAVYKGTAKHVNAPGIFGYLGIMQDHAALVSELKPGLLKIEGDTADSSKVFEIAGGFVEVVNNQVTLLVEAATPVTAH